MAFELAEPISRKKLDEAIREGRIDPEYETEWAKDEDGIARPVGSRVVGYKGRKTGKPYFVEDEFILNIR